MILRIGFRLLYCAAWLGQAAAAQVFDDFADGDFSTAPAWTGDTDRFSVIPCDSIGSGAPCGGGHALRSSGETSASHIHLATASNVAYGRWRFRLVFDEVNLSTANGLRFYLVADSPDLLSNVRGYYLQAGTNNLNQLRLYRQDGPEAQRELLGQTPAIVPGTQNDVDVEVQRDAQGRWRIAVNDTVHIQDVMDNTYTEASALGVWIRHSSLTGQSYLLDFIDADPDFQPNLTPPEMLGLVVIDPHTLRARFSEPVLAQPGNFAVAVIGHPDTVSPPGTPSPEIVLTFVEALPTPAHHVLTVEGVIDESSNVISRVEWPFFVGELEVPEQGDVVINEIYYAPPSDQPNSNEYLELYNRSERTFDLIGFSISNNRTEPVGVTQESTPIPPGGYAVLVRNPTAFVEFFPDVPANVPVVPVASFPVLLNSADRPALWFGDTEIDTVPYVSNWGGVGIALERIDPRGPSEFAFNWASTIDPAGGTPGSENSVFAPVTDAPAILFAEQILPEVAVLHLDLPPNPTRVELSHFQMDRPPQPIAVGVSNATITLTFAESIEATALSVEQIEGWSGQIQGTSSATLHRLAPPGALIINEVQYRPRRDPHDGILDAPEYIEVFNRSAMSLSLSSLAVTNAPTETGSVRTIVIGGRDTGADPFAALAPDQYAVVVADTSAFPRGRSPMTLDERRTHSLLPLVYTSADLSETLILPVNRMSLSLVNAGDTIRLLRGDGVLVDSVTYDPSWHRPEILDAVGIALERVSPEGPSWERQNWSSSLHLSGGTPGERNSLFIRDGEAPTSAGVFPDSPFAPDRGEYSNIRYTLHSDAGLVRVRIFDAAGRVVRHLEDALLTGRQGQLLWDGRADDRRALRIGIYIILLEAVNVEAGTTERHRAAVVVAR